MRRFVLVMAILGGCGSSNEAPPARPVASARQKPRPNAAPATSKCSSAIDVAELLGRHARAYGSPDAVAKSLPRTFIGEVEMGSKKGRAQLVLGPHGYRGTHALPSFFTAWGRDDKGLWAMRGSVGVVERTPKEHETTEATESLLDEWLDRRAYTTAEGRASCIDDPAPRVDVAFARPDLGEPVLAFDLTSAALLSITRRDPSGTKVTTTIASWMDADANGVRWPKRSTFHPPVGSPTTTTFEKVQPGWACERLEANGPTSAPIGEGCLLPPNDRMTLRWPKNVPVHVPFTFFREQILVRVRVGGREVFAIVDSGAGVTVIDATTPAGQSFKPALEVEGAGGTQKVRLGFGETPTLSLGDLHADTIPTASVPIPALDSFGTKRPEMILGYSFFAATITRIDFKRRELVFGKELAGLVAKDARSIPMRVIDGRLFADATVEGHRANVMLDTGSSGGLDFTKKWGTAHGLPGGRPTIEVRGLFGAGTREAGETWFRAGEMSLGPIKLTNAITSVADRPSAYAGIVGNDVFARCDAIVFDREGRKLWLEGACDRAVPERKMGWRLTKNVDPKQPGEPWIVSSVVPTGSADVAGIKIGDRILEVAGKPLGLDLDALGKVEEQPAGTKVPVVVLRDGKRERLLVELRVVLR